ncbi:MAG: hypothetical protein LH618_14885 [Saprospiraceae bacterium]|nr:hypothetical protein [Saprospiraceae bacterium]
MAQSSDQSRLGQTSGDSRGTETIAGRQATGKIVSLPFTMKELTDIYMSLQTADEREAFWQELNEKMKFFTEEQNALFVISWSESLNDCLEAADKTIEASRQLRTAALQVGWTFPEE